MSISEEQVKKILDEMVNMQELVDDKEASPEMRSNARSYIRGIRKVLEILGEKCAKCDGVGYVDSRMIIPCEKCNGTGLKPNEEKR